MAWGTDCGEEFKSRLCPMWTAARWVTIGSSVSYRTTVPRLSANGLKPVRSGVRSFDRSPICTLALAHYLGFAVPPLLHSEIARIRRELVYDHRVFFVEELGFIRPTAARRISRPDSLRFARVHRDTYRRAGFQLVDIPRADIRTRVELIRSHLTAWT
jgi:predicted ATPase